jgi:hypothetical protein
MGLFATQHLACGAKFLFISFTPLILIVPLSLFSRNRFEMAEPSADLDVVLGNFLLSSMAGLSTHSQFSRF